MSLIEKIQEKFASLWKKRTYRRAIWLLLAVAILIFPLKLFFSHFKRLMPYLPPCPSICLFRIYCPGCGSVRATYSLFHGDIHGVFANNLLYLLTVVLLMILIINPEFGRRRKIFHIYTVLLIAFFILRNLPWYPFSLLAPAGI